RRNSSRPPCQNQGPGNNIRAFRCDCPGVVATTSTKPSPQLIVALVFGRHQPLRRIITIEGVLAPAVDRLRDVAVEVVEIIRRNDARIAPFVLRATFMTTESRA